MSELPEWSGLPERLRKAAEPAKRAVSAGNDVIFVGPPGCGKTMVARRLRRNPKDVDTMGTDTAFVYRLAGIPENRPALWHPFRAPHHTVSALGLYGSARMSRPGELSLAHGGILFLDDAPEFSRAALETIVQVHKEKVIHFERSKWIKALPANFVLVSAASPCPCGFFGSRERECKCSKNIRERYLSRLEILKNDSTVIVNLTER